VGKNRAISGDHRGRGTQGARGPLDFSAEGSLGRRGDGRCPELRIWVGGGKVWAQAWFGIHTFDANCDGTKSRTWGTAPTSRYVEEGILENGARSGGKLGLSPHNRE